MTVQRGVERDNRGYPKSHMPTSPAKRARACVCSCTTVAFVVVHTRRAPLEPLVFVPRFGLGSNQSKRAYAAQGVYGVVQHEEGDVLL